MCFDFFPRPANLGVLQGSFPQYTEQRGISTPPYGYRYTQPRFWTSGFFPGSLWLLYERSTTLGVAGKVSDTTWKKLAIEWTEPLREYKARSDTHDRKAVSAPITA